MLKFQDYPEYRFRSVTANGYRGIVHYDTFNWFSVTKVPSCEVVHTYCCYTHPSLKAVRRRLLKYLFRLPKLN